jgi:hypothetical protein
LCNYINGTQGFNVFVLILGCTFTEIQLIPASMSKVECCHFSSDGKLLATGGHDRKVRSWFDWIVLLNIFLVLKTVAQGNFSATLTEFFLLWKRQQNPFCLMIFWCRLYCGAQNPLL